MTPPENLPRKGDILAGKYQVEGVLGAGGMGVVLSARDVALGHLVAVKLLLPAALKLPGAAARFLREAQAAAAIRGEHVARVLDAGTLGDGAPYLAMEHLSGLDLARHLKQRGPMPVEEAVDCVLQASEALAEAHALGIVHRDLKPGNLFLTRRADGSPLVKVLDFGLSKMAIADEGSYEASLTATNVVAGSPHYMSPEQMRSLKNVDARTDVWALGVILYELLTGKRPFEGNSLTAISASVAADRPAPARTLRPEIPEAVDALILACLEKDPDRRVPAIAHLAAGLSPFGPRRPEPVEIAGPPPPGPVAPQDAADVAETAVTVQWQARPSRPETPPAPTSETITAVAPPAPSPFPDVGPPAAPATGPIEWGHTQAPFQRPRSTLVIAAAAIGLALAAAAAGLVLARGADPGGPEVASTGAAALPSAPSAPVSAQVPSAQATSAQAASAQATATAVSPPPEVPATAPAPTATVKVTVKGGAGATRPPAVKKPKTLDDRK